MAVPDLQDALNCLQQNDVDGAIATLEDKIEELPAHLTAHVLLARAHETKQEWDRALKCWENVYFLMPNSPVAREGKRRVLRRVDRAEEAEDIETSAPSTPAENEPSEPPRTDDEPTEEEPTGEESTDEKSIDQPTGDTETPATAPEAVSGLEDLRRQAEAEARRGSTRAAASNAPENPTKDRPSETPAERVDELESEGDELDRLIDELESARIEPSPDVDEVPAPDLEHDVDDLVSETLARIHEAQDQYRKAAQIYVKLASQEPEQARQYLERAAEMRRKAERQAQDENA